MFVQETKMTSPLSLRLNKKSLHNTETIHCMLVIDVLLTMTRNRNRNGGTYRPDSGKSLVIASGVTSEWIKPFYENYDCSKHRAECAACQKKEEFYAEEEFNACAGCQISLYCSRECQKAHWKEHKEFCKANRCTEDNAHYKKSLRKMKK